MCAVPVADARQDRGIPRVVGAVELRSDVEEELSAQGDRREEVAHDLGGLRLGAAGRLAQGGRVVDLADMVPLLFGVVRVPGVLVRGRGVVPVRVAPGLVEDGDRRFPGALGLLRLHLVVPSDLEVGPVVADARVDHDVRLQLVRPCAQLIGLGGVGLAHVVPEFGDLPVPSAEEFLQLGVDVLHVALFVQRIGVLPGVLGLLLPVDVGEVETELDADLLAGL